jgi:hypothetical protein
VRFLHVLQTVHLPCTPMLAVLLAGLILTGTAKASTPREPRPETTRPQAIAIVRAIINQHASSCKINAIRSIAATRSSGGWRMTAKLVISASGKPLNETAIWTVRFDNRQAVAANQLAAELETGCP